MIRNKDHYKVLNRRAFLYSFLFLIFSLIFPEIPESRSNVYPESLIGKVYAVDILNVNYSDSRSFSVKRDFPVDPLPIKHHANNKKSQPLSDGCYFKEAHREIADRGPETALLAFSGEFLGYPINSKSITFYLPFVAFSSWTGNSSKIRPPPF